MVVSPSDGRRREEFHCHSWLGEDTQTASLDPGPRKVCPSPRIRLLYKYIAVTFCAGQDVFYDVTLLTADSKVANRCAGECFRRE